MQATGTLHESRISKGLILVVVAMLCAALLGGLGGYLARTSGQPAAGGAVNAQPKVDAIQGDPNSDLTRVLPTSAPADPATGYDTSNWSGSSTAQPDHGVIP